MTRQEAVERLGEGVVSIAENSEKFFVPQKSDLKMEFLLYRSSAKFDSTVLVIDFLQKFDEMKTHPKKSEVVWNPVSYKIYETSPRGRRPARKVQTVSCCIPVEMYEFLKIEAFVENRSISDIATQVIREYYEKIRKR